MLRQNEIAEILTRVDGWSPEDRVALAYEILRDMRFKTPSDLPQHIADLALGMGRTSKPAMTDEQVDALMAQHRMDKHG